MWYSHRMTIFGSPERTHEALVGVGYRTTTDISTVIYKAAHLNKPLLLEGPAGGGKTQLARSVAEAEGMPLIALQCYEGLTDKEAIGDFDKALQDLYVLFQSKKDEIWDFGTLRKHTRSRDFFIPGPLIEALESEERCVLLIDEVDKISMAFQAQLLELLSLWQITVPKLGTIKAKHPPFTVITSNGEGVLGFPLRRRCAYMEIGYPTPEAEAAIVASKTPNLPPELHRFIAGLAKSLRDWSMKKPPSISEMIDLAMALDLLGKTEISPADKGILMPLFAKTLKDREKLLVKECFEDLIKKAKINAEEIERQEIQNALEALAEEVEATV